MILLIFCPLFSFEFSQSGKFPIEVKYSKVSFNEQKKEIIFLRYSFLQGSSVNIFLTHNIFFPWGILLCLLNFIKLADTHPVMLLITEKRKWLEIRLKIFVTFSNFRFINILESVVLRIIFCRIKICNWKKSPSPKTFFYLFHNDKTYHHYTLAKLD